MRRRVAPAPALLPCIGLLAGTALALHAPLLPVAPLIALLALALAWGRAAGVVLGWLALGALAGVCAELPHHDEPWLDPERPAVVVARITGHPRPGDGVQLVWARLERARQGGRTSVRERELRLLLPAEAVVPAIGARLRLRGYVRRSPGQINGPPRRPGPWRMRVSSPRLITLEQAPSTAARGITTLRRRLVAALEPVAERPGAALVQALVLGDPGRLPEAWRQGLRRVGLAHVLAVSGLHVALLGGAVLLLAWPLPRIPRLLLVLAVVLAYLALVGPRPSALRAALMAALACAALLLERPPQSLNALACAVIALVLADPAIITDLGFRLSAAATAAILVLAPALAARWTVLPRWLRLPLAVTVAAQLATLPFILPVFALVAPSSPLANLLVMPWLVLTLGAGLLWAAWVLAVPSTPGALLSVIDLLTWPLIGLAELPAGPWLTLPLVTSGPAALVLASLLVSILLRPRRGAAVALVLLLLSQGHAAHRGDPELVLLDVGQGESILIRDGRRTLLVDGGGWPFGDFGGRVLLPALASRGIRRLDAVLLTHPDVDHCRGLVDLARYLPLGEVRFAPTWTDEPCAAELLAVPGLRGRPTRAGDVLEVGRWRLRVLHPPPARSSRARTGINDRSLVLLATVHGRRVLLTGDAEAAAERRLLRDHRAELAADVLKIAHHGSKTSTGRPFLRAVNPRLALISAGYRNRYGHPAPVVLERLESAGARILRSDRGGAIELRFAASGAILLRRPGPS